MQFDVQPHRTTSTIIKYSSISAENSPFNKVFVVFLYVPSIFCMQSTQIIISLFQYSMAKHNNNKKNTKNHNF